MDPVKTYTLTFVRIALGLICFMHGLANAFGIMGGPGIEKLTADIAAHVSTSPELVAYLVAYGELICGLALILGMFAKIAALLLLAVVVVGCLVTGRYRAFFLKDAGFEYALALAAMSLVIAVHGPGALKVKLPQRKKK